MVSPLVNRRVRELQRIATQLRSLGRLANDVASDVASDIRCALRYAFLVLLRNASPSCELV